MKSWIEKNDIEMYSTQNEGKSVIDKLDDKVNKYNNTYHNTIEINPVDVKLSIYIDYCKEIND